MADGGPKVEQKGGKPDRPSFAAEFPSAPELHALLQAFARGDYHAVRAEGRRLAATSADDRIRRAAQVLVARTEPDRIAVALLVLAAVLLVMLAGWSMLHGRPPPS